MRLFIAIQFSDNILKQHALPEVTIPEQKMTVRHVSLMRSDRGKNGMIYTEIGRAESD